MPAEPARRLHPLGLRRHRPHLPDGAGRGAVVQLPRRVAGDDRLGAARRRRCGLGAGGPAPAVLRDVVCHSPDDLPRRGRRVPAPALGGCRLRRQPPQPRPVDRDVPGGGGAAADVSRRAADPHRLPAPVAGRRDPSGRPGRGLAVPRRPPPRRARHRGGPVPAASAADARRLVPVAPFLRSRRLRRRTCCG